MSREIHEEAILDLETRDRKMQARFCTKPCTVHTWLRREFGVLRISQHQITYEQTQAWTQGETGKISRLICQWRAFSIRETKFLTFLPDSSTNTHYRIAQPSSKFQKPKCAHSFFLDSQSSQSVLMERLIYLMALSSLAILPGKMKPYPPLQ